MRKIGISFLTLVLVLSLVSFAGAYEVFSSGPLSSFNIQFFVNNNGPGTINQVDFTLKSPFDIEEPVFNVNDPPGVTSTVFYADPVDLSNPGHYAKFGFTFTGFTNGAGVFSFNWDPDIVGDPGYSATIGEMAGTLVTLFATEGKYCGLMEIDGDHLTADLCCFKPVPVPPTLVLLGSGLLGLISFRRKT